MIERTDRLADFPESVAAFGRPDHSAWKAGDRLIQRDLAATLERIAAAGPDEFYTGRTAQIIARYMEEKDGRITAQDLAAYQAKVRPPVHTTFRGCEVWGMGPPSSGGVVLCQMLNILEQFDLKADGAHVATNRASDHRSHAEGVLHPGHEPGRPRFRDRAHR